MQSTHFLVPMLLLLIGHLLQVPLEAQEPEVIDELPIRKTKYPELHRYLVTDLDVSSDGHKIVASFWKPAINRPGTDWGTWTAQWDLKKGTRTVYLKATAPVKFDETGTQLFMGTYQRSRVSGYRMGPIVSPAIWNIGGKKPVILKKTSEPIRTEKRVPQQMSILAATFFHPSKEKTKEDPPRKYAYWVTNLGELFSASVPQKEGDRLVPALKHSAITHEEFRSQLFRWYRMFPPGKFSFDDTGAMLTFRMEPLSWRGGNSGFEVTWKLDEKTKTFLIAEQKKIMIPQEHEKRPLYAQYLNRTFSFPDLKMNCDFSEKGIIRIKQEGKPIRALHLNGKPIREAEKETNK